MYIATENWLSSKKCLEKNIVETELIWETSPGSYCQNLNFIFKSINMNNVSHIIVWVVSRKHLQSSYSIITIKYSISHGRLSSFMLTLFSHHLALQNCSKNKSGYFGRIAAVWMWTSSYFFPDMHTIRKQNRTE